MNFTIWNIITWIWIFIAGITFWSLYYRNITAPFGRHTSTSWGPMINNTLGWILMEAPSLFMIWASFLFFKSAKTPTFAFLPMALWSVHYINRSFIYPLKLKDKKKQMPLVITFSAISFNLVNGFLNGLFLAKGWFYLNEFTAGIGLLVFVFGMYINIKSDSILIHLRKPGETTYKIPKGFLFEKVSCPNLFGELIEWFGFLIVAPSTAALSFWLWTFANLVPRARDHHRWYLKHFSDYPKERKILLPKIW